MVIRTLGELVPLALAVALSPPPVIAVVVIAASRDARRTTPAFAAGWLAGLLAVTAAGVLLLGGGDEVVHSEPGIDWGKLAIGLLLLGLAVKKWRSRPRPGEPAPPPSWLATLDTAGPGRALSLGLTFSAANPKNLAMAAASAATIAEAGLDPVGAVVTALGFVALGSVAVLSAVLAALLGGDRATAGLATVREFMTAHNAVIIMVVLILLGGTLVGDALGDLLD